MEPEDAIVILQEIIEVKAKYDIFSRLLKVPTWFIDYDSNDQDHLLQVIDEFLKQNYDPTWRVIINALKHPLLNYHQLAKYIEEKYGGKDTHPCFLY